MIGTREQHEAARADLLEREKEHMRRGDELARRRRELPWVPVEEEYVFQTTAGERTLTDLFEGRSQLLVLDDLQAYRERMGWKFDWVSSEGTAFNRDLGATTGGGEQPGFSVFVLEDGVVHHTYSSWDRGCEIIDGAYHLIDLSPKGRQEDGLGQTGWWWRLHDEYEQAPVA